MEVLTYADLEVPKRLVPSFEKLRAAVERDDFRSPDLKKLTGRDGLFLFKLDDASRIARSPPG